MKQGIQAKMASQLTALTDEDWMHCIGSALSLIRPLARDLALTPIGDLVLFEDDHGKRTIKNLRKNLFHTGTPLDTRVFYPTDAKGNILTNKTTQPFKDGILGQSFFGMNRNMNWVRINIAIDVINQGRIFRGSNAETVPLEMQILRASGISPRNFCLGIFEAFDEQVRRREAILGQMRTVNGNLLEARELLKLFPAV